MIKRLFLVALPGVPELVAGGNAGLSRVDSKVAGSLALLPEKFIFQDYRSSCHISISGIMVYQADDFVPGVVGALRGEEVASLGVEEGPGLLFSFPPPSPRSSFLLEGVVLCSFCKRVAIIKFFTLVSL